MAGVDKKEREVNMLVELHRTGREVLKQTINVLQAGGSLDLTADELENLVNQKMKYWKYKFEKVEPTATSEQRDIINYYIRLQVLMNKAYKKYLEYSRDFDRLSLKIANLMEEVLSLEAQAGLRRLKSKIATIYSKFNELPQDYQEYSNTIKKELVATRNIVTALINEKLETTEEERINQYIQATITISKMLVFVIEYASMVEAMTKIFEVICKRYKMRVKLEDITQSITSYDEVVSRKEEFLLAIDKVVLNNEDSMVFLETESKLKTSDKIKMKRIYQRLESYSERKEVMYKNYKSLNKIAKDRIERYLDEEAKSWGDDFDTLDIEEELIDDIIVLYVTGIGGL